MVLMSSTISIIPTPDPLIWIHEKDRPSRQHRLKTWKLNTYSNFKDIYEDVWNKWCSMELKIDKIDFLTRKMDIFEKENVFTSY